MNHRGHFQYKPLEKVSMEVIGKNGFKVHKVHKSKVALAAIDTKKGARCDGQTRATDKA